MDHDSPLHHVPGVDDALHAADELIHGVEHTIAHQFVPDLSGHLPGALEHHDVQNAHDAHAGAPPFHSEYDFGKPQPGSTNGIIAHALDTIKAGHDLTPTQMAQLHHISQTGTAWDGALGALHVANQINADIVHDDQHLMNHAYEDHSLENAQHTLSRTNQVINEQDYARTHPNWKPDGGYFTDPKQDPTSTGYVDSDL